MNCKNCKQLTGGYCHEHQPNTIGITKPDSSFDGTSYGVGTMASCMNCLKCYGNYGSQRVSSMVNYKNCEEYFNSK